MIISERKDSKRRVHFMKCIFIYWTGKINFTHDPLDFNDSALKPHARTHSCTLHNVFSLLKNFPELLKFPGESKNCYVPIFSICNHGHDFYDY
jgi:hypothetical protein